MARSAVNYTYEADLAFRAPGSGVATAGVIDASAFTFGTATGIDLATLDKMVNAREGDQKNKLGSEFMDVVIVVSSADVADTDEEYTFNVYVGTAGAGAGGTLVGSLVFGPGAAVPGQYVVKLDSNTIENLDADREEIALELVEAGTTPAIDFSAWLAYGEGKH